jgi:LuxR family maltose regulon positive regulatory protein
MILAGDVDAALKRIAPALSDSQRYGRGLSVVKLSLLKAAALNRLDQRSAALRTLIQTADVAVAGGLVQPFLAERELIEDLLPALIEAGERVPVGNDPAAWREFVRALGGNLGDDILTPVIARTSDANLQLTDRERDMLAYLDAGLSNREIGDRLGIQIPTVKWHLHNLFSKIGVRNRSSAVRFARDKHLL